MRKILFRAWDPKTKTMHYSDKTQTVWAGGLNASVAKDGPSILLDDVMQFTGLIDKNGKEIYEGDILQWPHLKGNSPVEVYYNQDECVFVGRPIYEDEKTESWLDSKCEIIGNIYETPDLLG